MKNIKSLLYLTLIIVPFVFGCGGSLKEHKKNASSGSVSAEKYFIDTKESVITWSGSMLLDIDQEHVGYVYLSKGDLLIEKDTLVGGKAEINMSTIEYKDKANTNTPIKHLKSPDYFDVDKFPISTIVITKVETLRDHTVITGDLTIKGVTRPVTFPARVEVKDGIVTAAAKLVIDRTQWGIRYRSGKFYDNLADQIVSDDIEFLMKIVARK